MKRLTSKNIFKASIILNLILLVAFSFLFIRIGYASKIVSLISPNTSITSPTSNPQYLMRGSLFKTLPNSDTDIVFVGDSITEKCNWNEFFPEYNIKNRGIGSDTTQGVLDRIDDVITLKPGKIFIMVGVNDINLGHDLETVGKTYSQLLNTIKKDLPNTDVYIHSVLPTNDVKKNEQIKVLNEIIKQVAEDFKFEYIDLYDDFVNEQKVLNPSYTADGIHLMGEAYQVWINKINDYLE